MRVALLSVVTLAALLAACGDDDDGGGGACEPDGDDPALGAVDCREEFDRLAARPLDASLAGAFTVKTIIDQADGDAVYFLDTGVYPLHESFAVDHLSWPFGQSFVGEYLYPQRRFLLGSITYFAEPDLWTYELAPYDTATADMILTAFDLLAGAAYFGPELAFHPTSVEQEARAAELPDRVRVVTTEEIYRGATYQPLNLGQTVAQIRLVSADQLDEEYVSPREIAVLDRVPNDISVVAAVVTEEFQTPLSHVNVLSQQRRTPNMALRGARDQLGDLAGRWVRLTVGPFEWSAEEVTQAEADAWWEEHRPEPVEVPDPDTSVTGFPDVDDLTIADLPAVGGKASQFGELRRVAAEDDDGDVVVRDGFAIPVHYYAEFASQNGFDVQIEEMLADEQFRSDGTYRRERLAQLEDDMRAAPLDPDFLAELEARIDPEFGTTRMRFRSSSTAEDLAHFAGAGLYSSASGVVGSAEDPVADAVREVWASLWKFRAFEEREYAGIDHTRIAMGILVHPTYVDETAQGVAITANLFDPGQAGEDAFYINVQQGDVSVVQPPESGIVADQLLYFYFYNNQPATYFTHSSLVADGQTVLSRAELFQLGSALSAIRDHFAGLYELPDGFARLPLDIEFERVGGVVEVKQARPHPGRGQAPP
ncbi:MAG TPA: PEP/pyruvate-binding domain-containing protein [Kofleriaceae bacterium]|nr:PEP/pyruvate-binding domain-containing protein [Kofleriaceae bacterium]